MGQALKSHTHKVIGPDGQEMGIADLPSPQTKRWVARRKAEVVAAVEGGLLSIEQACRLYALTVEEFMGWEETLHRFGLAGLRNTEVQRHRHEMKTGH